MSDTAPFVTGVDFVAIPTADYETAATFYGDVLGLPFVKRWGQMPAGEFQAGNLTLAVMQSDAFGLEFRSGNTPIALQVDDVAAARNRLEEQGVTFQMDTLDSGVCHQAFFADPDGNPLILHHRYAPKS
jgi:catechol 2,3-dioxygenase-like lactoylglutathione lyase family enzyme